MSRPADELTSPQTDRGALSAAHWLVPNLLLLFLVAVLSFTYPVEDLSRRLGDAFFWLRADRVTSSTVAIIAIDDLSLDRYGRWPWSRTQLARIVNAVSKEHPASIGLDLLLSERAHLQTISLSPEPLARRATLSWRQN